MQEVTPGFVVVSHVVSALLTFIAHALKMSEEDAPKLKASVAGGLSTTSLPRRLLSHRWVITDAKIFLEKKGTDGLRSPNFSVLLPKNLASGEKQEQTTIWHLQAYKNGDYFYIYLCQGSREAVGKSAKPSGDASKVLSADCTFRLLDFETGEIVFTKASQSGSCLERKICNESPGSCGYATLKYADVDKYLCRGTLTIQVESTLLCLTDPMESAHEQRKPLEVHVLTSLFENKLFADVTIKCGDAEFKVHKAILASQSPVFKKMLESDMKEQRTNVIEVSDVDQAVISDMLAYLYTGSAPHMDTLVKELLNVANKYELPQLFAMCENHLKSEMNVASAIELLVFADMHHASYLKEACLNYIYHNSAAVHSTSQWKELKKNCDSHASLLVEIMDYTP